MSPASSELSALARSDEGSFWHRILEIQSTDEEQRPGDLEEAVTIAVDALRRQIEAAADWLATEVGYQFLRAPIQPVESVTSALDRYHEAVRAPAPLLLATLWERVGVVSFLGFVPGEEPAIHVTGARSEAPISYADPLQLLGPLDAIRDVEDLTSEGQLPEPAYVSVSRDRFTKAGVSGGDDYYVRIPGDPIDPLIQGFGQGGEALTLSMYIRRSLMRRGFLLLNTTERPPWLR
jgi:hypothetical protein